MLKCIKILKITILPLLLTKRQASELLVKKPCKMKTKTPKTIKSNLPLYQMPHYFTPNFPLTSETLTIWL